MGVFYLFCVVVAFVVLADAIRLDARRGALGGGFLDMGPVGWFLCCLLLSVITWICYLATRPQLVQRHRMLMHGNPPGYGVAVPPQPLYAPTPPPGWYVDPAGGRYRWWDGVGWTAHTA